MVRPPRRILSGLLVLSVSGGVTACGVTTEPRQVADFRIEAPPLSSMGLPAPGRTPDPPERSPDPERAKAAPRSSGPGIASGAPSDAEIAAELRQAFKTPAGEHADPDRSIVDTATLSSGGLATIPPGAPREVRAIITAANQVATRPYVYGGGHGRLAGETFVDTAYDCSGSISFAFASAGLIKSPMVSGDLARWGKPGPGKWVTIYANGGHAWMTVGGLRFDTSGLRQSGSRWQTARRSTAGFTVRHPPGL